MKALTLHHPPGILPSPNRLVPHFHLLHAAHHSKGQVRLLTQEKRTKEKCKGSGPPYSVFLSSFSSLAYIHGSVDLTDSLVICGKLVDLDAIAHQLTHDLDLELV